MTGIEPMSMGPAEFARFVASESESAAHLVNAAGITPQAAQTGAAATGSATGGPRPAWQQRMEEARRSAAAGNTKVLRGPFGVLAMYNNPSPFCYKYMIPGDWVEAEEPGLYRSRSGKASAGVAFRLAREFEGARGATLVERAATVITREHEKAMGRALAGITLTPFESVRPSTWKWMAASSVQGNTLSGVAPKVLVDLSPEAVAQITVFGTPDDDDLARSIIESLKTTSDPKCYWAELERELRLMYGDR